LNEEKSKHVGLAQQNWVFFFFGSEVLLRLVERTHQKSKTVVREECDKYDLIAAPLFLIGRS
jgi:hypothetical protein